MHIRHWTSVAIRLPPPLPARVPPQALKLGDAATAAAEYEALLAATEGPHAPSDAVHAASP
jgi:hypothetical protein